MKKIGTAIFDLDGVLIDSIENMEYAWNNTCKKIKIKIPFKKYKKHIGLGLKIILKKIGVPKKKIKDTVFLYNYFSTEKINNIKFYPEIFKTLKKIKKKHYIAIFTSKNRFRTMKCLKLINLKFDKIITADDIKNTKPSPEGLIKIKNFFIKKTNKFIYFGDTNYDYLAAKSIGMNYIHCSWGIGNCENKKNIKIKKAAEMIKYLN
jgi:HAD superfamily hydrolase (TIGR01549 family)